MPQPKKSGAASRAKGRSRPAPSRKPSTAAARTRATEAEVSSNVAAMRELLNKGVVLSGERLQETVDEAVRRGRMTRQDAEELVQSLVQIGRRQTQDVLVELEALLERGTTAARKAPGTDRALAHVDRARRAAGVGTAFPISGYDDLTAAQVTARLNDLTPAELRKIRDHERRNANRKSVLGAVERKLG